MKDRSSRSAEHRLGVNQKIFKICRDGARRSTVAAILFFLGGQTVFSRPTPNWPPPPMLRTTNSTTWHSVKITPSPQTPKIHFYNKLNPVWWLENADDAVPPDWYRPDDKNRALKWRFRNPFHNFTFYVIGVADKKITHSGFYPERNFNPHGGWDFEIERRYIVLLPFLSYERQRVNFYFGWRERGDFGMELKFHRQPAAVK